MDLLVDMPVREAAEALDVSVHRVRALAHAGAIHAIKQGRDLRLSRRDVDRLVANRLVGGRPYKAHNAWQRMIEGDLPHDSAPVLLARLSRRGQRRLYVAHPSLLDRLASDDRLLRSGHSAADVPLGDGRVVEAYVASSDLDDVVAEYRLRDPEQAANVILRVVPPDVGLPNEMPPLVVALDLLESPLPRVRGVGEDMLTGLL